ncbi:DUF3426 domain-containing protein [Undibacterium sp. Dicai25W]|uniref:DUF3426 domain-containing protein n=1 Tax=Undibacterium sp. Dicai25W TaxID=3413034 RepID=UPI003BF28B01
MALATRCPHCQTTFRVANDQLKLHAGLVRCGSCQQTFNGVEHLIPLDTAKAAVGITRSNQTTPALETNTKSEPAAAQDEVHTIHQRPVQEQPPAEVENIVEHTEAFDESFSILPPDDDEDHADPAHSDKLVSHGAEVSEQVEQLSETRAPKKKVPEEVLPDSAASLDFDLGEDENDPSIHATPPANLATKAELDTKAALLDSTDAAWSVTDTAEHPDPEIDRANATDDELASLRFASDAADEEPREPYIGEAEAALAQHAALSEDSVSDAVEDVRAEDKPDFVRKAEREQKRGRIVRIAMLLSCLILLPALLLQLAYIFRVQISANFPEARPVLTQACGVIHCQIGLPAQIEHITLESNELESPPPDAKAFALTMQLQNNGTTVQTWPHVELVLNDEKDKAVLQKAFAPSDYLNDKNALSKGFAPKSQQNIKLYFELPKLKASGYHVSVFYP